MKSLLLAACLVAASPFAGAANADIVAYEFTGVATSATGEWAGATAVSGFFSYNTDAVVTAGGIVFDVYETSSPPNDVLPGFLVELTANGITRSTTSPAQTHEVVVGDQPTQDFFVMRSDGPVPSKPAIHAAQIGFDDSTATAFAGTGLPAMLDLADFDSAAGTWRSSLFRNGSLVLDVGFISFNITGLTAVTQSEPVPEPGTLALFGAAALAGWAVRRRRRNA